MADKTLLLSILFLLGILVVPATRISTQYPPYQREMAYVNAYGGMQDGRSIRFLSEPAIPHPTGEQSAADSFPSR